MHQASFFSNITKTSYNVLSFFFNLNLFPLKVTHNSFTSIDLVILPLFFTSTDLDLFWLFMKNCNSSILKFSNTFQRQDLLEDHKIQADFFWMQLQFTATLAQHHNWILSTWQQSDSTWKNCILDLLSNSLDLSPSI